MSFVFWLVAALTIAGGLAAVLLKNLVHCALALTIAFLGLALLFLQLDAQFAGFAQILVYVGAVAILVVFAILLTRSRRHRKTEVSSAARGEQGWQLLPPCLQCSDGQCCRSGSGLPHESATPAASVQQIGWVLMGRYVLPLEIVALLLTAALIGAVIVAMHEKDGAKD